jgi:hypothetical protein
VTPLRHGDSSPALRLGPRPVEVTTDRAAVYPRVLEEIMPSARRVAERYANNSVEADHGRLKARLLPTHGLTRVRSRAPSQVGMRSFRTCAAGTTRSPSTFLCMIGSVPRSPIWLYRSDHGGEPTTSRSGTLHWQQRNRP